MFRFVLRRIGMVIPTFIGITILAFALIHLIPGDPIEVMMGERGVDPAMHAEAMKRLGLDLPLPVQYFHYVGHALNLTCGGELEECLSGDPVEEFALEGGLDLG